MTKATVHTIAERCGVSSATVSRALRRHPSVKAETMEYICRVAEEMGYKPNFAAKSLSLKKQAIAGGATVYIPFNVTSVSVSDPLFFDYFCGLTDRLGKAALPIQIMRFANAAQEKEAVTTMLATKQVAGVLDFHLHAETLAVLEQADVPVVSSNWRSAGSKMPAVLSDHIGGFRQAWRYVAETGHKRVAYFGIPGQEMHHFKECRAAAVMEDTAERLQHHVVTQNLFSEDANWAAMIEAMGEYNPATWPTFFFAQNDFIAVQLVKTFQRHGISVPEQVSVLGFDDSISAQRCTPALTTIHKGRVKIGCEMASMLIELIHGRKKEDGFIQQIPLQLVVRESTGAAPKLRARRKRLLSSGGFTFVELLVSLTIIAFLLVLSFGAMGKSRQYGQSTICIGNLRQIGAGLVSYASEHNGFLPYYNSSYDTDEFGVRKKVRERRWVNDLVDGEYAPKKIFICPTPKGTRALDSAIYWGEVGYGINIALSFDYPNTDPDQPPARTTQVLARTILVTDAASAPDFDSQRTHGTYYVYAQPNKSASAGQAYPRHNQHCNVLWGDGRVTAVKAPNPAEPSSIYDSLALGKIYTFSEHWLRVK